MSLADGRWQPSGFIPDIAYDGVARAAFLSGAELGMVYAHLCLAPATDVIETHVSVANTENALRLAEAFGRTLVVTDDVVAPDGQDFIALWFSPVNVHHGLGLDS